MAETILATVHGTAWTESGFRASWRKARIKAGVTDVTIHDLRGTAVTHLAITGATVPEIAAITGHSMKEVGSIHGAHYMHRDPALSEAAIRKLEGKTISPNQTPDCPGDLVLNLEEIL
ncbi:tyrosine-type recombinase/integrase [Novosphingobium sp. PY1]|uniref:tyrosine-type recombinase/integrase n=1 Tax=Novosphingobium sp. PY1 TaxID=1882221 RepID=UPI0021128BA4|nr:tyrosine-type recombinase/integrase [Novosphingobium sp. PY1]